MNIEWVHFLEKKIPLDFSRIHAQLLQTAQKDSQKIYYVLRRYLVMTPGQNEYTRSCSFTLSVINRKSAPQTFICSKSTIKAVGNGVKYIES